MRHVVIVLILLICRGAHAEHGGRSDKVRVVHAATLVSFGAAYLTVEFVLKDRLIADSCRWCDPPAIDRSARALRWNDIHRADVVSDVVGYYSISTIMIGMLVASTWHDGDKRRWFDDAIPVLESAVLASSLHHVAKFSTARQRPFARFGEPGRLPDPDDNASFWSGHESLAFSLAVSAGIVARKRGYRIEPVVWAAGLTLAAASGYLRIAADAHYFSDVVVGAVVGTAVGIAVPVLFHSDVFGKHSSLAVTPTSNGFAIAGTF